MILVRALFVLAAAASTNAAEANRPSTGVSTDLHRAILAGDAVAWRSLLKSSVDPNARDPEGNTPLHLAALRNNSAAVDDLLAKGADAKAVNEAGSTPLHYGVTSEQIVAALLAQGAPADTISKLGVTPLLAAASQGDSYAVARRLIAAGAKVNYLPIGPPIASSPVSPLNSALKGGDERTVELLLDHAADVNPASGPLPLTFAAINGDIVSAKLLLNRGARLDHRAGTIGAPLATAAMRRNVELVTLFLEHGADPKVTLSDRHQTPAIAFSGYNDSGDPSIARLLIARGADVNAEDNLGNTALSYALKRGSDTPLVHYLREAGARPPQTPRDKPIPARTVPEDVGARTAMIRDSVERAIALLQSSSRAFLTTGFVSNRGCTSCHHQALPAVAFSLASERGLRVDVPEVGHTLHAIVDELSPKTEHARQMLEPIPAVRVTLGYDFDALHAWGYARDDMTDAMSRQVLAWQDRDGSWRALVPRGPMEDQIMVGTAWSVRAIQLYPPTGREDDVTDSLARARKWLHTQRPELLNDRIFQLLGLAWATETVERMRPFADGLIAMQRDDGGWGQLPTLPSDAWATGTALLALFKGGIATSHPAYQRGVNYLLRTQFDDGSWWVRSRSWPIQPHFDSKFPHGRDQWISAGGTAFAAIALLHTLGPTVRRETLPDARSLIAPFTRSKSEVVKRDAPSVPDSAEQSPATVPALTFTRDIKSLVERSCSACHLGKKIKGGLSFATRDSLLKGGESGEPAVVPGHASQSLLLDYVSDQIEDLEMPPIARRDKYPALSAEEISLFRQWIDAGAVWDVPEATGAQ